MDNGCLQMSSTTLLTTVLERGGYEDPVLNENLYLHFKGFRKIGKCIGAYSQVKSLWLESNGIDEIDNLSGLKELRCLFLQQNMISTIENLESLRKLVTLDLSANNLNHVQGLRSLVSLSTLNLCKNSFETYKSVEQVAECKSIQTLNLSENRLREDRTIALFPTLPNLSTLHLHGNPITNSIGHYRKTIIVQNNKLKYLDDRPVFDLERNRSQAWGHGGAEAERQVNEQFNKHKQDKNKQRIENWRTFQESKRAQATPAKRFVSYKSDNILSESASSLGALPESQDRLPSYEESTETSAPPPRPPVDIPLLEQKRDWRVEESLRLYRLQQEKGNECKDDMETEGKAMASATVNAPTTFPSVEDQSESDDERPLYRAELLEQHISKLKVFM